MVRDLIGLMLDKVGDSSVIIRGQTRECYLSMKIYNMSVKECSKSVTECILIFFSRIILVDLNYACRLPCSAYGCIS